LFRNFKFSTEYGMVKLAPCPELTGLAEYAVSAFSAVGNAG